VLINVDTEKSEVLVNDRFAYVSVSRARHDAQIYMNDGGKLSHMTAHGGFQHWQGENSSSDSWAGFGQAIRLTMAAFMQANPELAKRNGLTEANFNAEADRRISQYVENFFRMSGNVMGTDHTKEEAVRQCALGNPAACD
jgi:hypothetical protein